MNINEENAWSIMNFITDVLCRLNNEQFWGYLIAMIMACEKRGMITVEERKEIFRSMIQSNHQSGRFDGIWDW